MAESVYDRINDYGSVKIQLASPNDIRSWSFGEVKRPETINYRTYRPEKDGMFCERIFGPVYDWECACGKYKGTKHKGIICDRCGVKVTHSRVRRKRMGHINLAAPIVHIWFFKGRPSRLGTLLNMKTADLEKVILFQGYVVTDPGQTPMDYQQVLSEDEYRSAHQQYRDDFKAQMGAEAIKGLLEKLDLPALANDLREALKKTDSKQKIKDLTKRLKLVESIRTSGNRPEWMVMEVIPVIPPDQRPLVLLESGNFATSDLNDLYRHIINRNNRLKKLMDLNAPEVIIRNEKRKLQQAVDALFDNGRCRRPVQGTANRPLKSLTDMIKGKQGRFRENLLGKRVDYSARSVIVVDPKLKLHQCGLPKKIALELYQPFIIRKLKDRNLADTIKSAKQMIERRDQEIWGVLDEVICQHPVLLNRTPTLHRMGIQAFEPVLVEGNAIHIHPLVCKGFNAGFDGGQMAVHLPLSLEAQAEAHVLMLSTNNIFSPANGQPVFKPTQDMIAGINYLTSDRGADNVKPEVKLLRHPDGNQYPAFAHPHQAIAAHYLGRIGTHARIILRLPAGKGVIKVDNRFTPKVNKIITTVGRCIFNDILDPRMPFYNYPLDQTGAVRVISDCYAQLGRGVTLDLLDKMKDLGFRCSTLAGVSFGITDATIPSRKTQVLADSQAVLDQIEQDFQANIISDGERYNRIIDVWIHAREEITNALLQGLKEHKRPCDQNYINPLLVMIDSHAGGSIDQFVQLAGMRGLVAGCNGKTVGVPVISSFRGGLSILEYYTVSQGARSRLAEKPLLVGHAGYLARKLADVAQNVVISELDCHTLKGITKFAIYKGAHLGAHLAVPLREVIVGRVARENIVNPTTDQTIVKENQIITAEMARQIEFLGMETIRVRSPLTCRSPLGLCAKCYGHDLSTGKLVEEGMAVGIIAAQSIGEISTQYAMSTWKLGDLPGRRLPKSELRAEATGQIAYVNLDTALIEVAGSPEKHRIVLGRGWLAITDEDGYAVASHPVPYGATVIVQEGQRVVSGQRLATWNPYRTPIFAGTEGSVSLLTRRRGKTVRAGHMVYLSIDGDMGQTLEFHCISSGTVLVVEDGQAVEPGTLLAYRLADPRTNVGQSILRAVQQFEARKPKDPAVLSEISGQVEISMNMRQRRIALTVRSASGTERTHEVSPDRQLLVRTGDYVQRGDPLSEGPLNPQDILAVLGEEALQQYMFGEIQEAYRGMGGRVDDKHIEIILGMMLRKVKLENVGDSALLPGDVVDKFRFLEENKRLASSLKVIEPGDSEFAEGEIVSKEKIEAANAEIEAKGGEPCKTRRPRPATAKTLLLGITKASLQSESFLSAASFQESTKVFTEAALAGKIDELRGLKENVILGHLIPAGTSFKPYLEMRIKRNIEFGELPLLAREELTEAEINQAVQQALTGQDQPDSV